MAVPPQSIFLSFAVGRRSVGLIPFSIKNVGNGITFGTDDTDNTRTPQTLFSEALSRVI